MYVTIKAISFDIERLLFWFWSKIINVCDGTGAFVRNTIKSAPTKAMTPIPPISIWMSRMIFPAVVSACATVTVDSPVALMALADRKKHLTAATAVCVKPAANTKSQK